MLSGTFAGSFKISAYITLFMQATSIAVEHVERIGGWQASRAPFKLSSAVELLLLLCIAGQAFAYPGVSQAITDEGHDD
ncbi:hypothetical protein CBS101457_006473 [Exobasidium rhododendri]|nr:hypothetical protein CBS101457_006473 [Exobasidium rhododendri]